MTNWVRDNYGRMVHFDTALKEMDEAICDEVNFALGYCDPQEFFNEYCEMHKAKYGEEFELGGGINEKKAYAAPHLLQRR